METSGQLPGAVVTLLAALWEGEDSDGGWNGGDTVETVCEWFEAQGVNITHPAVRGQGGYAADDPRERWNAASLTAFAGLHACDQYVPTAADQWPIPDDDEEVG